MASSQAAWLTGGEIGKIIRLLDWSQTPIGPVESWPQSLKTAVANNSSRSVFSSS